MRETARVGKVKEPTNPFYVLVVILGVVFLITACGYGTMTYRAIAPNAPRDGAPHPWMDFLDRNGMQLLGGELVALAAVTFGAMWLDRYRFLADQRPERERGDYELRPDEKE
jgi:hypothetical protein